MNFRKAERKQTKLRIGISAPSGGGKSWSSLLMARGLATAWDKIAVIDTENMSADLYSHLGDYNVLTLEAPFTPERYIEAIKICEKNGMEVIIIDSATHEWDGKGGCLEIQEQLGGRYQDWAKITPRHRNFTNAILESSCHVICTTRKKQDYEMSKDSSGKNKVEKVGLKEVQREGFEYELTLAFEVDMRHNAKASKDRTTLFMDKPEFVINEETGRTLKAWAESGATPAPVEKPLPPTIEEIKAMKDRLGALSPVNKNKATQWFRDIKLDKVENATKAQLNELDKFIKPLEAQVIQLSEIRSARPGYVPPGNHPLEDM